jgi:hypothetical protein
VDPIGATDGVTGHQAQVVDGDMIVRAAADGLRWVAATGDPVDSEWAGAVLAEAGCVPQGRPRRRWVLGGLAFLLRRRGATWAQRAVALVGLGLCAVLGLVFVQSILDDAPDTPWPYSGVGLVAYSLLGVVYLLACWRPALALSVALPALAASTALLVAVTDAAARADAAGAGPPASGYERLPSIGSAPPFGSGWWLAGFFVLLVLPHLVLFAAVAVGELVRRPAMPGARPATVC